MQWEYTKDSNQKREKYEWKKKMGKKCQWLLTYNPVLFLFGLKFDSIVNIFNELIIIHSDLSRKEEEMFNKIVIFMCLWNKKKENREFQNFLFDETIYSLSLCVFIWCFVTLKCLRLRYWMRILIFLFFLFSFFV